MRQRTGFALGVLVAAALAACSSSDDANSGTASNDGGTTPTQAAAQTTDSGSESSVDPFPAFTDQASFACADPLPAIAANLHPGQAVDDIELRNASDVDAGTTVGWAGGIGSALCDNASAPAQVLVYTRGATVGTVGKADLAAFLAPIDTPEEARLLVLALEGASAELVCSGQGITFATGIAKNADGTFDIIARTGWCPSVRTRYHVATDGTVTVVNTATGTNKCVC